MLDSPERSVALCQSAGSSVSPRLEPEERHNDVRGVVVEGLTDASGQCQITSMLRPVRRSKWTSDSVLYLYGNAIVLLEVGL